MADLRFFAFNEVLQELKRALGTKNKKRIIELYDEAATMDLEYLGGKYPHTMTRYDQVVCKCNEFLYSS